MCDTPYTKVLDKPYVIGNENHWTIDIPCGKCMPCIQTTIYQWLFRLQQELKVAEKATFVTLTYDDENVPFGVKVKMGLSDVAGLTLRKKDLLAFHKRIKINQERGETITQKLKYFACGEYGKTTKRPHYHLIIFNADNEIIDAAWKKGTTFHGQVTDASIVYVLNYINKGRRKSKDYYENLGIEPEFRVMSQGIGKLWLKQAEKYPQWENQDLDKVMLDSGHTIPIPRYYLKHLFTPEARAERADRITREKNEEMWLKREELEEMGKNPYISEAQEKQARYARITSKSGIPRN